MAPKLPTAVVTAIARPAAVLVTNGTYLAFSSPPSTHVYLSALERSNEQASRRHHVRDGRSEISRLSWVMHTTAQLRPCACGTHLLEKTGEKRATLSILGTSPYYAPPPGDLKPIFGSLLRVPLPPMLGVARYLC
eukprot:1186582-Prorocentrum_minimum.AAC.5